MDNKRKCPECGTSYTPSRSDQVFCTTTCRWNAWRKKKDKQKETGRLFPKHTRVQTCEKPLEGLEQTGNEQVKPRLCESLRGVITKGQPAQEIREPAPETKPLQIPPVIPNPQPEIEPPEESHAYKDAKAKKAAAQALFTRISNAIILGERTIANWENELRNLSYPKKPKRAPNLDMADLDESYFWNEVIDPINLAEKRKKVEEEIFSLKKARNELDKYFKKATEDLEIASKHFDHQERVRAMILRFHALRQDKLNQTKKKENEPEEQINTIVNPRDSESEEKPGIKENPSPSPKSRTEVETNDDLISNEQLSEMEFHCLDFQKKWLEFFGQPAVVFHLAVHGRSGHGKSNFCFQLANYLANNFGNTVYISGEEGFSKTLKDKKIFNKVDSKHIYWSRHKTFEAIRSMKNQFHFIFLDSLDTLGIDAVKLRELRELFLDSAFITISQSTKDGKMRGSNEILHDSDMAVQVHEGMATTTKNRFKQCGTQLRVFPSSEKSVGKSMPEPRNII